MSLDVESLVGLARRRLQAAADPEKAEPMAGYMKTTMPFYGVQKAGRTPILREIVATHPAATWSEYRSGVLALWRQPHREEKYLAIGYARAHPEFVVPRSLPLYRKLIVEGAWWDLVDEIAIHLVGRVLAEHRSEIAPVMDGWIEDPDMWLRRSAIIGQNGHKDRTDAERLFAYCAARAFETEFFIRKAIGWALREYARTDPDAVRAFVDSHELSGLSRREATKHL